MDPRQLETGQIHVESFGNNGNEEVFRHKLGLIPEETEGLTEAFKAKLGFNKPEEIADDDNDEYSSDLGADASIYNLSALNNSYCFEAFMKENFCKDALGDASTPLKQPLLKSLSAEGIQATLQSNSVLISHAIKTFCKDIQAARSSNKKTSNILSLVFKNLSHDSKKMSKGKGKEVPLGSLLSTIPMEELPLMQFIVCYGILSGQLRNEIYSQLCVQVMHAKNPESKLQAWRLQLLCAGCFLPSKKMIKYYLFFLNKVTEEQDAKYAKQIIRLLQRTNLLGSRYHPPNSLELKAAKALKRIMLPVSLADGRSVSVQSDSATTASELCFEIANNIHLKDQFGFAIYISVGEKVSSLGNGFDHVMDAIGECEQASNQCRWSLFFGKEIFTPWHDAEFDEVASSLIYCQIIKSVLNGEFKFKSEEDLSRFISRRCYVEIGPTATESFIKKKLNDFIPRNVHIGGMDENKWSKLIFDSYKKMEFNCNKYPREHVKWSIVEGAQIKWPLQFAALFEVHKISNSPLLSCSDVVLAISCRGIFLLEEPFKLLCGLHYYEIIEVTCEKGKSKGESAQIIIMTTSGKRWVFRCNNSEIVAKLVSSFIDGLRRRSRWAVAIHDFFLRDHTKNEKDDFRLKQGDIVELLDESSQTLPDGWMYGRCERNDKVNRFPYDCVYIFPTTKKPPNDFLSIFGSMSQKDVHTLPRKRAAVVLKKDTIASRTRQSFI